MRPPRPLQRPAGHRPITVGGKVWFWRVASRGIVARAEATGIKRTISHARIASLVDSCPTRIWSDDQDGLAHVYLPRHVAAWLSDWDNWEPRRS